MPEVGAINSAVAIHVAYGVCVRRSPLREQRAEICTIDLIINEQVGNAWTGVGDRVRVEIRGTGSNFAGVTDAVTVAVGLYFERHRTVISCRDSETSCHATWHIALALHVRAPANYGPVIFERNGVIPSCCNL